MKQQFSKFRTETTVYIGEHKCVLLPSFLGDLYTRLEQQRLRSFGNRKPLSPFVSYHRARASHPGKIHLDIICTVLLGHLLHEATVFFIRDRNYRIYKQSSNFFRDSIRCSLDTPYWILDTRCLMLHTGCLVLDARYTNCLISVTPPMKKFMDFLYLLDNLVICKPQSSGVEAVLRIYVFGHCSNSRVKIPQRGTYNIFSIL